ncbi:response regulator transcription factor [Pontiellaceae bacterium B12219]|nr:response regulator transcription factor [Pontiellaceae bacterium B12219]
MKKENTMKKGAISVWLIEDNAAFRTNLAETLNAVETMYCDHDFSSCEEALECLESEKRHPQVILIDLSLPGMSGIEGLQRIRARNKKIRCIVLTGSDRQKNVFDAICAGAAGYLLKNTIFEQITRSIEDVMEGGASLDPHVASLVLDSFPKKKTEGNEFDLTEREVEVLQYLASGKIVKQISDQLNLSPHTIKFHIGNIYKKLNVQSQAGAVAKGIRKGII